MLGFVSLVILVVEGLSILASMLRACFLRETFHKPVRLYMGSYGLSDQDSVNWST